MEALSGSHALYLQGWVIVAERKQKALQGMGNPKSPRHPLNWRWERNKQMISSSSEEFPQFFPPHLHLSVLMTVLATIESWATGILPWWPHNWKVWARHNGPLPSLDFLLITLKGTEGGLWVPLSKKYCAIPAVLYTKWGSVCNPEKKGIYKISSCKQSPNNPSGGCMPHSNDYNSVYEAPQCLQVTFL